MRLWHKGINIFVLFPTLQAQNKSIKVMNYTSQYLFVFKPKDTAWFNIYST